jgi:hypothetical protein
MSSGWPRDQQELRWPPGPNEDAWPPADEPGDEDPGSHGDGRESADPWAAGRDFADPWGAAPGSFDTSAGGPLAGGQSAAAQPGNQPRASIPQPRPGGPPDPEPDGEDEYDWYRYLSHGGSRPPSSEGPAGPSPDSADAGDGRPGRSQRAERRSRKERKSHDEHKNQDERKIRKGRKNQRPDHDGLTARTSGPGDAPYPEGTGPWQESEPAAQADTPGRPAGTRPAHTDTFHTEIAHTDTADTGAPFARAGDAWRADARPGEAWRSYPGPGSGQPVTADESFRQPGFPAPPSGLPATAESGHWPERYPDSGQGRSSYPDPAYGQQAAYAPQGYQKPPATDAARGDGSDTLIPDPPATPALARRPGKRASRALRPAAARTVRRAVHPDVLGRAASGAAASSIDRADVAEHPDVAGRPDVAGQPEVAAHSDVAAQPGHPDWPARQEQPGRADRPGSTGRTGRAASPGPAASSARQGDTERPGQPRQARRASRSRKRLLRRLLLLAAGALIAVAAAVLLLAGPAAGPAHVLLTPAKLGAYAKEPHLAKAMDASLLQQQVVTKSAGEAKNVVYAVYEDTTGAAAHSGPQIILFIGGNLKGASPSGFISSFIGGSRGALRIGAGSMGGDAACLPRIPGSVAECAWADNDTFGVLASPTLSVPALTAELRAARPQVEHLAK